MFLHMSCWRDYDLNQIWPCLLQFQDGRPKVSTLLCPYVLRPLPSLVVDHWARSAQRRLVLQPFAETDHVLLLATTIGSTLVALA